MKTQYENKLLELSNRINSTEQERDKVLKNLGGKAVVPEQVSKVKKEYQEKIQQRAEKKRLKKEHKEARVTKGEKRTEIEEPRNVDED